MRHKILSILAALFLSFFCKEVSAQGVSNKEQHRPNIIFLLTDDHRYNAMGAMGNEIIQTPNMDELASDGVLFTNAYVTTPICATSRASILSGQYARRHNIWDFSTFFSNEGFDQTYPMILKKHGYYTGFIGKWGVGDTPHNNKILGSNERMSDKEIMDMLQGKFDYWRGWEGQGQYMHKLSKGKKRHVTRIVASEAMEFLQLAPKDRPFCLSISFKAPHVQDQIREAIPEPRLADLYKNVTIPKPFTAELQYFKGLPKILQNSESRVRWIETYHMADSAIYKYGKYLSGVSLKRWKDYYYSHKGQDHTYQEAVKNYYRLITGIDMVIEDIRRKLKEIGVADNTVIILMGDNGMLLGDYGLTGKWYGYEASIRVPLVIYNPLLADSARGQVRREIALNIDIAPTILDIAGIKVSKKMQGRSLSPILKGKYPQWRNDFLFEHLLNMRAVNIPMSQGVVSNHYVYIQYLNHKYEPMFEQLFNLKKDPHELHNLARDSGYFIILQTMRNRMYSLIRQSN